MNSEKFFLELETIAEACAASAQTNHELFESTRLSRLPKLPTRPKFELPNVVPVCVGCGGRLDRDDNFQQSIKSCRKCLGIYARLDTAIDEASKRKRQKLLERFIGGDAND